jgi:hypothetical protein
MSEQFFNNIMAIAIIFRMLKKCMRYLILNNISAGFKGKRGVDFP